MKILVDQNIRAASGVFEAFGDVTFAEGRALTANDVREFDALIVRSVTRVNADLLAGSRVRFVGTTTIGTDHLDTNWLDENHIRWASAPGCNADSAAQYTLAMIWLACARLQRDPLSQTVGIIGCGNVGSRLKALLEALGISVIANDPPLQDQGEMGFHSLQQTLQQDIVCLHVPLTADGPYPTWQLINDDTIKAMRPGSLLVNSSRGDVIEEKALLASIGASHLHAALDVWPGEPEIDPALLLASTVATPHVAGYSEDGRFKGVHLVFEAFCDWLGVELPCTVESRRPPPHFELTQGEGLTDVLQRCCFVEMHDRELRGSASLNNKQRGELFDRLRSEYPVRRDFSYWTISTPALEIGRQCRNLGFSVSTPGNSPRD